MARQAGSTRSGFKYARCADLARSLSSDRRCSFHVFGATCEQAGAFLMGVDEDYEARRVCATLI
jgi:hypothetical protein